MQLVKGKVKNTHFGIAILAALVLDISDYLIIGAIPVYGDIFDLIGMGILFKLLGPIALINLVELIPIAGDFVPTFTITVIVAWLYKGSSRFLR